MGVKLGLSHWGRNIGLGSKKKGPKKDEVTGVWRRLQNGELYDLYFSKYYSGEHTKKNEMGRARGTHGGYDGVHRGFGGKAWGKWEHLKDLGVNARIILEMDLQELGWVAWTGFIWLRIGTGDGNLWMWWRTFDFKKNVGNFFTSRGPGSFSGRIVITTATNAIHISLNAHKQPATPQRHNCTVK